MNEREKSYRRWMTTLAGGCALGLALVLAVGCGGPAPTAADNEVGKYNVPPSVAMEQGITKRTSALWTGYQVGPYTFVTGQVSDTTGGSKYFCTNPTATWRMYATVNQQINGFAPPSPASTVPPHWDTKITASTTYLASDPTIALSTLDCPKAAMEWSSIYGVLYNSAELTCTIKGHVANGPTKSMTVTIPWAALQFTPGTNAYLPYWTVPYTKPSPWPDGTGFCGARSQVFGS